MQISATRVIVCRNKIGGGVQCLEKDLACSLLRNRLGWEDAVTMQQYNS